MSALAEALVPDGDVGHTKLEAFVGSVLAARGVWDVWRASDGIETCRVIASSDDVLRLCGRIWEIAAQSRHTFWLDVTRDAERVRWTLYFDVDAPVPERRARDAVHLLAAPGEVPWTTTLEGEARFDGGALVLAE